MPSVDCAVPSDDWHVHQSYAWLPGDAYGQKDTSPGVAAPNWHCDLAGSVWVTAHVSGQSSYPVNSVLGQRHSLSLSLSLSLPRTLVRRVCAGGGEGRVCVCVCVCVCVFARACICVTCVRS